MSRTTRRLLGAALSAVLCLTTAVALPAPALAAPRPQTPAGLPRSVEALAPYVAQTSCDPRIKPGTAALGNLLARTYPGIWWNSTYPCGTDGNVSEHYDGRAIDWGATIRGGATRISAEAFLSWLLAKDAKGDAFAYARRLGVMYVIYNNRIWGSWNGRWAEYNGCAKRKSVAEDSACHRDHLHISLSWDGALGSTSFWSKRVDATPDYGPCRAKDLNWASRRATANPTRCTRYPVLSAPAKSSSTRSALVKYSGAGLHPGYTGPAVTAVQRALGVSPTGNFGRATDAAIRAFQQRHRLPVTGTTTQPTWRALLASVR